MQAPGSRGAEPRTLVTITRSDGRRVLQATQRSARPIAQQGLQCRRFIAVNAEAHANTRGASGTIARSTVSGVAGAGRSNAAPAGKAAAQASRIACSTEIASINGGSPTALDR